jgi:hypothetical protein
MFQAYIYLAVLPRSSSFLLGRITTLANWSDKFHSIGFFVPTFLSEPQYGLTSIEFLASVLLRQGGLVPH